MAVSDRVGVRVRVRVGIRVSISVTVTLITGLCMHWVLNGSVPSHCHFKINIYCKW